MGELVHMLRGPLFMRLRSLCGQRAETFTTNWAHVSCAACLKLRTGTRDTELTDEERAMLFTPWPPF